MAELQANFDQAIDVLEEALRICPDALWDASMWHVPRSDPWVWPKAGTEPVPERTDESIQKFSAFANVAYHCLWFLDFYVSTDIAGFATPEYVRGGAMEMVWPADGAAPLPGPPFPRETLLRYLDYGRRQLHHRLAIVSPEELEALCPAEHPHAGKTLRQLLSVNLEHVRGHGRDLDMFLARKSGPERRGFAP